PPAIDLAPATTMILLFEHPAGAGPVRKWKRRVFFAVFFAIAHGEGITRTSSGEHLLTAIAEEASSGSLRSSSVSRFAGSFGLGRDDNRRRHDMGGGGLCRKARRRHRVSWKGREIFASTHLPS